MAIFIPSFDATFFHIPKTGGEWVMAALKALGLEYSFLPSPGASARHCLPMHVDRKTRCSFCFVRHPCDWLQSWFQYQTEKGWPSWEPGLWHPQRCIEFAADDDFGSFVRRLYAREPAYITRLYGWYTGPPGSTAISHVKKTEHLVKDFMDVIFDLHEPFDYLEKYQLAKGVGRVNESPVFVEWTADLRNFVCDQEKVVMRRYGYD